MKITHNIFAATLFFWAMNVNATIIDITTEDVNGHACAVASVTGESGGSTTCYGLFDGNDDVNDQYQIGSDLFSFLGKSEDGDLTLTGQGTQSGTWAFSNSLLNQSFGDYFLVIKAGTEWGAYLFSGSDNQSTNGEWVTDDFLNNGDRQPGISHMSIYAADATTVPEPSIVALLGLGLLGMGLARRKAK
jgi:hypothetical protein